MLFTGERFVRGNLEGGKPKNRFELMESFVSKSLSKSAPGIPGFTAEPLDIGLQVVGKAASHFFPNGFVLEFFLPAIRAMPETTCSLEIFAALSADIIDGLLHAII